METKTEGPIWLDESTVQPFLRRVQDSPRVDAAWIEYDTMRRPFIRMETPDGQRELHTLKEARAMVHRLIGRRTRTPREA